MYSCKGDEIHEAEIVAIEYKHFDIIALQHKGLALMYIFIPSTLI